MARRGRRKGIRIDGRGVLGDELKRRLGREDELQGAEGRMREARAADAMLLFNRTRRVLFENAYNRPCTPLNRLAARARVSPATAKYHLDLLVKGGLLSEYRWGKQRLFYPAGLLDPADVKRVSVLNDPKAEDVYGLIRARPGIAQRELAEGLGRTHQSIIRAVDRLRGAGAVRTLKEGRNLRHFPAGRTKVHARKERRRQRMFRERFLHQLKNGGFRTRVHRATERELVVSMEAGEETVVVTLEGRSPFEELMR